MVPPRRAWRPPHCPFEGCVSHTDPGTWRWKRKGFYERDASPSRIQRYFCRSCNRSFSSQTFSTTYWLKKPGLQCAIFFRVGSGCSALRQIAFELGVSHSTIQRHVERLGRHCLLLHERLRPREIPKERLVLDGFRTFEFGQYYPFDIHLLVGESHYVYDFQDAELRRSGTMTRYQRRRRAELEAAFGRPDPQATRKSVEELMTRSLPEGAQVRVSTDEHKAYPPAFRRLAGREIEHDTTSSKARRTTRNPLFPVNRADLLIRHEGANHKRETIAFSKRRQGAMYRLAIWAVFRNYLRPTSVRKRTASPGVAVGATGRTWTAAQVLAKRLLPWRSALSGWLEDCYYGRIPTRRLARCAEHALQYAC